MSDEVAISANLLTKSYRIWTDPAQRLISPLLSEAGRWLPDKLSQACHRRAATGYRDFFALQDVSFEVKRGEAVAIVGRNGAGKSTLLQLIAGTLQPTSGHLQVNGRIAALLELGAGFNTDFTGRENVYLSGAVLGISKAEMDARFDEIAAFADIGDFIEQPVKIYSSGMMMRLAFAVNTCVNPDILIVDEALSVGDAPFQAKCFRRFRQLIDNGVSLLFVSHDIGTVRSICQHALWLSGGRVEIWGDAKTVAREYEKYCWSAQGVQTATPATPPVPEGSAPRPVSLSSATAALAHAVPAVLRESNELFVKLASDGRWGTGAVRIQNAVVLQPDGERSSTFNYDTDAQAWFLIQVNEDIASDFILGLRLNTLKGEAVLAVQELHRTMRLDARTGHSLAIKVNLRLPLHHSDYSLRVAIMGFKDGQLKRGRAYDFGDAVVWDVLENCAVITVRTYSDFPLSGPVHLHGETEIFPLDSDS